MPGTVSLLAAPFQIVAVIPVYRSLFPAPASLRRSSSAPQPRVSRPHGSHPWFRLVRHRRTAQPT